MAFVSLPISNEDTHYEFKISLDEQLFVMNFRFNFRSTLWIMDILTEDSEYIYMGIPLQANIDILKQFRAYSIPQGFLLAWNSASSKIPPDRNNFSEDVLLVYDEVST